nr:integrase, catalytic region, zinc finger, CCHC-type, peptidase aspartic, catalytic [Tanacetum cinerariifolium]
MRVESINGKRYVLVVVDDYSRYTWVFFLHSNDEAFEVIISLIKKTQVNLQLQVRRVRTDNGTEFRNKTLAEFFDEDIGKLKAKGDIGVFVGYSKESIAFRIYNKRTRFENPSYFEKAKDLRPSLYYEKVIGLGDTPMFLIHSDEALEIEKFKRARENKIEFAYDYGNLNASYQTSSLKPYVLTVSLEKIIIDLEDEVVSLLEKEKANLKTIESLKLKGFKLSENAIFESENQSEMIVKWLKKNVTTWRIQ